MPVYTVYRWHNDPPSARQLAKYHERDIKQFNSVNAMTALAELLVKGNGVPRDPVRALQLYERAATCDCPNALVIFAQLLIFGARDIPPDWRRAANLLEHAIERFDSAVAMQDLSYLLERGGHGLRRDRPRAHQLLERCLHYRQRWEDPDPNLMCRIAKMITSALPGFPYDIKRGVDLYKRALKIDPGLTNRMIELAHLYAEGRRRFPPDILQAAKWYKRARHEHTLVAAKLQLADRLADGVPGRFAPNYKRAVAFYEHAIEHDNSSAAVRKYASLLAKDTTRPEGPRRAVRMLEQLIEEQQDDRAVYELAMILEHGAKGVRADPARAFHLLEQASHRRDVFVLTLLSDMCRRGAKGVQRDIPRAIHILEQILEDEVDLFTLCRLASVLQEDADDVPTDKRRAQSLFEQAIAENERVGIACWGLACLLERGDDKSADTIEKVDRLYASALKSDHVTLSLIAYRFIASISLRLTAFVPVSRRRTRALYRTYLERGDDGSVLTCFGADLEKGCRAVSVDKKMAVHMYEQAISKFKETASMLRLAKMLLAGDGVNKDVKRAVTLLQRAADGGNTGAMCALARLLEDGEEVPKDFPRALKLYRKASKAGDALATHSLALMYTYGKELVEVDKRKAVQLYERLIEEEPESEALYALGTLLVEGDGIKKDVPRALKLYERAIEMNGNRDAMVCLASALEDGKDGVEVDKQRAFELYERAIEEHSDPTAMNNLALMLEDGAEGIAMDRVRSLELYEESIEMDEDPTAVLNLAQLLNHGGGGISHDVQRAAALYERAISLGEVKHGPYNYGRLLIDGYEGVEINEEKALELFRTSMSNGNEDARWWLAIVLCTSSRELERSPDMAMKDIEAYVEEEVGAKRLVNLASFKFYLNREGKVDLAEAKKLYERAKDEFDDELAMVCLACHWFRQDDSEQSMDRGCELLEEAVEQGDSMCGKLVLASVLCSGVGHAKHRDAERAIKICEEEIARYGNGYNAAPVKGILAALLRVQQFPGEGDFERAVRLCEAGIAQRDELLSKLALGNLLSEAAEERRDLTRAKQLYSCVIHEQWDIFVGCSAVTWLRKDILESVVAADGLDRRKLRFVSHDPRTLARLNLASLCIEQGEMEEGVKHLRDGVEKDDSAVAMVALSGVLRYGKHGVGGDEEEAVRLMQRVRAKRSWMPRAAWQLSCAV